MKIKQTTLFLILLILCLQASKLGEKQNQEKIFQKMKSYLDNQYNPSDQFTGEYIVKSIAQSSDTQYEGYLQYNGDLDTFLSDNNPVIKTLKFFIILDNNNELTFKIQPDNEPFFEIPQKEPFPYEKNSASESDTQVYEITQPTLNQPFNFAVTFNGVVVFDTENIKLVFTRYYVAIGSNVYGESFWGWGQQRGVWEFDTGYYTIYNLDNPTQMTEGYPGQETYGTHPVFLQKSNQNKQKEQIDTQYYMTYLRTSVGLQLDYNKNYNYMMQLLSGPIELKFFMYSSPKANVKAYSQYVNGWTLPPFWSLGFHICRYGWQNTEEWASAWQNANENNIAFDTIWSDIDYMQNYEDFTISTDYNVDTMKEVTDLNDPLGVHWVPIIDAGIGFVGDSGLTGENQQLFIKSEQTGDSLIGCVWPGAAYFMDWNKPGTKEFWIQGLKNITEVYNGPQPSGIWLDMNDPSSFTDNDGQVFNPDDCVVPGNNNEHRKLVEDAVDFPWSPLGDHPIQWKTISGNGEHYNEQNAEYFYVEGFDIKEIQMHNLYAFLEGIPTRKYLEQAGYDLPFIVSRSSFPGQGQYTQLWTGDNYASWDQLKSSLGDVFNFQIFQVPMVGPDVCGFSGETTPELCARWYQLGAFYPFFRSHNAIDNSDQYPWSFPNDPYVLESSRNSIFLRYTLLKWYYTIFVREHPHGTIFKPLFFEYPYDEMAQNEAHQALIGNEVMITPVLDPAEDGSTATTIKVYFPGDQNTVWYRYQDPSYSYTGGEIGEFAVPFYETCPFFIRSGSVIVWQPQYLKYDKPLRSRQLDKVYGLIIGLDENEEANGNFLGIDDYTDSNVKQYCMGDQNCLLKLKVNKINSQQIQIQITPLNNNTNYFGDIIVTQINLLNNDSYFFTDLVFNKDNTRFIVNIQN